MKYITYGFLGFTEKAKNAALKQKQENTLEKLYRYNDEILSSKNFIVTKLFEGSRPTIKENYSYYSPKTKDYTKPKTVYTLGTENSYIIINKTEYDFSEYLIENNFLDPQKIEKYQQNEKQQKEELERLEIERQEREKQERKALAEKERLEREKVRQEKMKLWYEKGLTIINDEMKRHVRNTIVKFENELAGMFSDYEFEKFYNKAINELTHNLGNEEIMKNNVSYYVTEKSESFQFRFYKELYSNIFNVNESESSITIKAKVKAILKGKEYKGSTEETIVYYVYNADNGYTEKEGYKLKYNHDKFEFFITKENGKWKVTEGKSGLGVFTIEGNKTDIKNKLDEIFEKMEERISRQIENHISKNGISPLYNDLKVS